MQMSKEKYWDKSEFGFFETLEDEDKLLYLYDLMIGEFSYMEIHNEGESLDAEERDLEELLRAAEREEDFYDDEEQQDSWDFETDRNEVKVEFVRTEEADYIKMLGPTLAILLKVANDMQMNGMILVDKKIEFTKYVPWDVVLTYKVIGNAPPFSIN